MELLVIGAFCLELIVCVALDLPVLVPLTIGLVIFLGYGRAKGHGARDLGRMTASGVLTAKGVLESFALIGILTALWRACGTISQIVVMTSSLITPSFVPVACFLLCGLVSYLMGTSFGTGATMGVVCATIGNACGGNPYLLGGAVLAGCYFGDRCSPVSSSALLVRSLTGTKMRDNLKAMMRTAAPPLVASLVFYAVAGAATAGASAQAQTDVSQMLRAYYEDHLLALVPAAIIFALPLMGVGMKRCMAATSVAAALVCVFLQGATPVDLARWAVMGFTATDAGVNQLMAGGGLISMVNVSLVVCLSSAYAGIFEGTGLLAGVQGHVSAVAQKFGPFAAVLAVSIPASMIACNQTLAIVLTRQLCGPAEESDTAMAIDLENAPVVISPLVPWSIACTTILTLAQAPVGSEVFAVYLWLIVVYQAFCRSKKFFQNSACNLGASPI